MSEGAIAAGGVVGAPTGALPRAEPPRKPGAALASRRLGAVVGLLVLLGVAFRLAGLGDKLYWIDEGYTSLRVYGYIGQDIRNTLTPGADVAPAELRALQRRSDRTSAAAMLRSLAFEDPQHPPLYYAMLYAWTSAFGDSVATIRALSVLVSLLVLPAAAWLRRELFPERHAGLIVVGLLALSPVQILYAQEAREYMVWELFIVLSTAGLVRAVRRDDRLSWTA